MFSHDKKRGHPEQNFNINRSIYLAVEWRHNGKKSDPNLPCSLLTFLGAYLSGDPLGALVN